jgi:hypothetical protein
VLILAFLENDNLQMVEMGDHAHAESTMLTARPPTRATARAVENQDDVRRTVRVRYVGHTRSREPHLAELQQTQDIAIDTTTLPPASVVPPLLGLTSRLGHRSTDFRFMQGKSRGDGFSGDNPDGPAAGACWRAPGQAALGSLGR